MGEVCLLLALATPLLASANPNSPHHHDCTSDTSALHLPGTHAEIGATCAHTRAPSTPRATARVRRAPRPPQRAFTKPNQRAASVAIPHSLFPIIATPAAAHPISLCRDSTAASNFSYSTWVFVPTFLYSTCAISPTFGEFFPRTGSGREENLNRLQEFCARAAVLRTARTISKGGVLKNAKMLKVGIAFRCHKMLKAVGRPETVPRHYAIKIYARVLALGSES